MVYYPVGGGFIDISKQGDPHRILCEQRRLYWLLSQLFAPSPLILAPGAADDNLRSTTPGFIKSCIVLEKPRTSQKAGYGAGLDSASPPSRCMQFDSDALLAVLLE